MAATLKYSIVLVSTIHLLNYNKAMGISLGPGLLCEVVPEQSAEPQRCVREDPSGQLPQSLSFQHWDVSCQAVTQQGHVTLLSHILHPPGDNRE